VTGPHSELLEGLNLLAHLVRGPSPDRLAREALERNNLDLRCGLNSLSNIADTAMRRGQLSIGTASQICVRLVTPPPSAKVKAIWSKLFADPSQWTVVADSVSEAGLASGLRSLVQGVRDQAGAPTVSADFTALVSDLRGRPFKIARGEDKPGAQVILYIPFSLAGAAEGRGLTRSLKALRPQFQDNFWQRLRTIESGSYAPSVSVVSIEGVTGQPFLKVEFVCAPRDVRRLVEASWDEFSKIQRNGLGERETANITELKPAVLRDIDQLPAPARYALSADEAAQTHTVAPATPDETLRAIRKVRRQDMIIFEFVPVSKNSEA
jgi:hypothetical protein